MKKLYPLCAVCTVMLVLLLTACGEGLEKRAQELALSRSDNYSRDMSKQEFATLQKLTSLYFYEQKRSEKPSKLPASFEVENADKRTIAFYMLPESEMTNDELLQLIDLQYAGKAIDFMPAEGLLQYEDVRAELERALNSYGFAYDKDFEAVLQYRSKKSSASSDSGIWLAKISCKNENSYDVALYADTNAPSYIYRRPKGTYTYGAITEYAPAKDYSDEQILTAAQDFCEAFGIQVNGEISLAASVNEASACNAVYHCALASSAEGLWQIYIDLSDLSICGFDFKAA